METYVLSMIGADRAGLVDALSEVVADHGGDWGRSQMAELAGLFAGMVLVRVPRERSEAFLAALAPLRERGLLDVTARPATDATADGAGRLSFAVVGTDRPGIVRELSRALATLDVGIVDLKTDTESAAMDGGLLFRAEAIVRLPEGVARADVVAALENLSADLMVDVRED